MRRSLFDLRLPLIPSRSPGHRGPGAASPALLAAIVLVGLAAPGLRPTPAAAQSLADYDYENLTFRAVGLGAGYLWSGRVENTEEYHVRFDLGYLGPGIRIVPSLGYWSSQIEGAEIDTLAARMGILPSQIGTIEWSDISLAVDAHFVWSAPLGLLPYVGLGAGLHALNGRGPRVDNTFVEDLLDNITAGVNGIVGFEVEPINRVRLYAEGRYTAMNSLRYGSVRAGLQIMFSRGDVQVGAVSPPSPGPAAGRSP